MSTDSELYLIRNRKTGKWFMGSLGDEDGIWAGNIAVSVVYSSMTGPRDGLPEDGEWVRFTEGDPGATSQIAELEAELSAFMQLLSDDELARLLTVIADYRAKQASDQ